MGFLSSIFLSMGVRLPCFVMITTSSYYNLRRGRLYFYKFKRMEDKQRNLEMLKVYRVLLCFIMRYPRASTLLKMYTFLLSPWWYKFQWSWCLQFSLNTLNYRNARSKEEDGNMGNYFGFLWISQSCEGQLAVEKPPGWHPGHVNDSLFTTSRSFPA